MVSTYKHFKKHEEVFLGLSLFTLVKLAFLLVLLAIFAINFKLSPNSPLFLFVAIIDMIIVALVIKADSGDEVKGFYSSFLTHPFKNHIFPVFAGGERLYPRIVDSLPEWKRFWNPFQRAVQNNEEVVAGNNEKGYHSLIDLHSIAEIRQDLCINKEGDLVSFLKLERGLSWASLSGDEKASAIDNWGRFLSQLQSISSMNSYFNTASNLGDSVQAFVWAKRYECDTANVTNSNLNNQMLSPSQALSEDYQKAWRKNIFKGDTFIPDLQFYLIVRHKRARAKIHPIHKFCKKLFPAWLPADLSVMTHDEYLEELDFLKQKIDVAQNALLSMDIKAQAMTGDDLQAFCNHFMPVNNPDAKLEDKSKYLTFQNKHTKTYRLQLPPEDGALDAWVLGYLASLETESYISVHWTPRDALSDRRKAERKADLMIQIAKSSKSSTAAIIKENRAIADELVEQSCSFDMSLYLTIVCDSLEKLQKTDNRIRRPVAGAILSPLDRQQVHNWLYSLPFAHDGLHDSEKLFASKNFAQASFPFFKSELGSKAGPLLGLSLEDMRPILLDEYDRNLCNNRNINFIGDSGSGKTVSAKLAIKRRFDRGGSFIIVDNTQDGWKFFMDFYGGNIIDIDTSIPADGRPYFAPLALSEGYDQSELNAQIERVTKLLTVIKERATVLDAFEEVFLIKSLQELYASHDKPCLSDLYKMWKKPTGLLLEEYSTKLCSEWAELVAPYCRCTNGIYSGLMDGNHPRVGDAAKLSLFTFTKIDSNSNFLPVSLALVANYVSKRVVIGKEAGVTFVIDEAWKMFSGRNASKGKELLTYFARAGRGMDLGLWTISQKPQDLPREIHSSASASLSFQLKEASDKKDMASLASLTEVERSALSDAAMSESGTCLLKTTRSSGLLKVLLDPLEEVLCNSTRDFVNRRNHIFETRLVHNSGDASLAAMETVEELIDEMRIKCH